MKLGLYAHKDHKGWHQILTEVNGDTVKYKCEEMHGCRGHTMAKKEFNKIFIRLTS